MEALRAFALVNMGREVFTAKTFLPRESDVFLASHQPLVGDGQKK